MTGTTRPPTCPTRPPPCTGSSRHRPPLHPDAVAVRFGETSLSYAELNAAANQVAHVLRGRGVGAGTVVAVCAERSPELMAGLLGVLKAGGAYLPLDPDYPPDRLAFMLADAFAGNSAPVLLTQRALEPALPATTATTLRLDEPTVWADAPATDPPPFACPDDIAYVIYTSGSTGPPKGVPNTHRGIGNRLHWMQRRFALTRDDVVLQKTPISFDVSVWELFWALRCGARLVLATSRRPQGRGLPARADRPRGRHDHPLRAVDAEHLSRRPPRRRRLRRAAPGDLFG